MEEWRSSTGQTRSVNAGKWEQFWCKAIPNIRSSYAFARFLIRRLGNYILICKSHSEEATLWLSLITSITVAFAFIFSFVGGWVTERFVKASNFTFFMTLADLEENLPFLWPQLSSRLVLL